MWAGWLSGLGSGCATAPPLEQQALLVLELLGPRTSLGWLLPCSTRTTTFNRTFRRRSRRKSSSSEAACWAGWRAGFGGAAVALLLLLLILLPVLMTWSRQRVPGISGFGRTEERSSGRSGSAAGPSSAARWRGGVETFVPDFEHKANASCHRKYVAYDLPDLAASLVRAALCAASSVKTQS